MIDLVRRYPSAGLLFVQLLGVLLYPMMEHAPAGRALFGVFGLIVLASALRVVRRSPWLTWFGLLLALPVAVLLLVNTTQQNSALLLGSAVLESLFYFYATGSLIAYMMQDQVATTDELFAAGATFTLLAWAFAYVYVACQVVLPGSFTPADGDGAIRSWMELLFLSFTILSGVGLGDIVPLTPMARALVMIEEFFGVMYLTLVVSRLIGLTVAARR